MQRMFSQSNLLEKCREKKRKKHNARHYSKE
jgi:hypothetical protein